MKINEKFISVNLEERSYPLYIGVDNLSTLPEKLKENDLMEDLVIITNPEVISLYKEKLINPLEKAGFKPYIIEIPSGEKSKSFAKVVEVIDELIENKFDRMTPFIAFGGGVVGDLAGLISALYMRGVPYIQIPTTLLAQLDSSVGGKVAVNRRDAKNIIGCFYQPKFVLADVTTLESLPKREYAAGLAETIKYSLIANDHFLGFMEENIDKLNNRDSETLVEVVKTCCRIKAKIVEQDERDLNLRAVLNYGHTIGHAIEAMLHFNEYLHGEAVAIGMVASAYISTYLGYIDESFVDRLIALLKKAGLPTSVEKIESEDIIEAISHDKKVVAGEPRFVLLKKPGETVVEPVKIDIIKKAVERILRG